MIEPNPATTYFVSAHQTAGLVLPCELIIDLIFN